MNSAKEQDVRGGLCNTLGQAHQATKNKTLWSLSCANLMGKD